MVTYPTLNSKIFPLQAWQMPKNIKFHLDISKYGAVIFFPTTKFLLNGWLFYYYLSIYFDLVASADISISLHARI